MAQQIKMSSADWGLLLLLSLLWGGSFFFVQLAVGHIAPFTIVFLRVFLAAIVLALVLWATGTAFPRGRGIWSALLLMGFLNNALPFSFFVLAQGQIGSALASVLNATTPLFTLVAAHFLTQDERLSRAKALGLGLGFAGVIVTLGGAALVAGAATVLAQLACLAAALCYALAGVWGRRFKRMNLPPLATAFGMLATTSLLMLPLVLFAEPPWKAPSPGLVPMLAVIGLALLSTGLAYLLYFRLLARVGAVNLALVTFLIPVSAIALGVLVLEESLALRHLLGMGLIALGLLVIDGRLQRRFAARGEAGSG